MIFKKLVIFYKTKSYQNFIISKETLYNQTNIAQSAGTLK